MSISRSEKEHLIKEIEDKLKNSKSMIIVNYHKLNVPNMLDLRSELRQAGIELKVYKNRIFKIAAKNLGIDGLDKYLIGQNAFSFADNDSPDSFKILHKFAKKNRSLEMMSAVYQDKVLDQKSVLEIAVLPSKEDLICMFASSLKYSVMKFALTLKAIEEKKEA
ncbi:50S ribosomal protein L10 [Spiroplasma endosymbiont of Amphibalanus improvisus]|uniref:50S ribosomal protein L10 n=1 Tax=Spiroplasma endosymbiont of Amphibalanus improvisus TaxID=3066327 RepID=UPI00313D0853